MYKNMSVCLLRFPNITHFNASYFQRNNNFQSRHQDTLEGANCKLRLWLVWKWFALNFPREFTTYFKINGANSKWPSGWLVLNPKDEHITINSTVVLLRLTESCELWSKLRTHIPHSDSPTFVLLQLWDRNRYKIIINIDKCTYCTIQHVSKCTIGYGEQRRKDLFLC